MSTTTIRARIARTAAVAATVLGVTLGTAMSAQAASMSASLVISGKNSNNLVWVTVDGLVPMSQANAQFLVNDGATTKLRLMGDDATTDQLLYGPYFAANGAYGTTWIDQAGLHYRSAIQVPANLLNEDRGFFADADEIVVRATFVTREGATIQSTTSNVVVRNF